MNLPITSRIKRSPLLQTTTTVPIAGSDGGTDEIIKGDEITTDKTWDDMRAEGASEEDIAKAKKWREDNPKGERIQVGTGTYTPNVVVKGKGVDYDGTAKIETIGDVFQPWETRTQSRSIKKEGRDNRRSDIKKARNEAKGGGTFDEEGNYTEGTKLKGKAKREYIKKARQKAKAKETDFESKEFAAASVRNSKSRASGRKPGTLGVRTGEVDMTMSELEKNADSVKAQDAHLKKNAEIAAKRKAVAESQKITTSSTEGDEVVSGYRGQGYNAIDPNTALAMRKSGVGKKKATPYKMKGSMFNKNY